MIREVLPQLTALVVYGVGGAIAPTLFTALDRWNTTKSLRYLLGFSVGILWGFIFILITEIAFNSVGSFYGFAVYAVSTALFTVAENYERPIMEPRPKKAKKVKKSVAKRPLNSTIKNKKALGLKTKNRAPKFGNFAILKWIRNRRYAPKLPRRHR